MPDTLLPRTFFDRGPPGEQLIDLDQNRPEVIPEAGGDSLANELDSNVGGAPSSVGLDSGGAVGVRRGLSVGRPGFEYETAPAGETDQDIQELEADEEEERRSAADLPLWADSRLLHR